MSDPLPMVLLLIVVAGALAIGAIVCFGLAIVVVVAALEKR